MPVYTYLFIALPVRVFKIVYYCSKDGALSNQDRRITRRLWIEPGGTLRVTGHHLPRARKALDRFKARKPKRATVYRAIKMMEVKTEETAVIGDQIFTDVSGGNRAGLFTIPVTRTAGRESPALKYSGLWRE